MPKAYWIARVDVHDPETYKTYVETREAGLSALQRQIPGARRQDRSAGRPGRGRNVVIEFASYEQALACYHSPEYQAAAEFRRKASLGEILVVEGA